MANNQDARPFVDLRKDANEFKEKFDEDIEKIITFFDAKITALICDPDSLESPSKKGVIKSTALVEFSKAKFEIFNNVKSVMNQMEREWLKYISEMKKLFIENVEIFLAGTKLEVKLPTDEFRTSPSYKQSPRKDKSSLAESIYPIIPMINTFAKNMAALSSPFQKKDTVSKRLSRELMKDHQSMLDQLEDGRIVSPKQSSASKRGRKNLSRATSSSPRNYTATESSASDSESQTDRDTPKLTPRGRSRTETKQRSSSDHETQSDESKKGKQKGKLSNSSVPPTKRLKESKVSRVATSSPLNSPVADSNFSDTESDSDQLKQLRGKAVAKGKKAALKLRGKTSAKAKSPSPSKTTSSVESESESGLSSQRSTRSRPETKGSSSSSSDANRSLSGSRLRGTPQNEKRLSRSPGHSSNRSSRARSETKGRSSSSSDANRSLSGSRLRGTPQNERRLSRSPSSSNTKSTRQNVAKTPAKSDVEESNRSIRSRGSQQPVKAVKQTPQSIKKKNAADENEDIIEIESISSNTKSGQPKGVKTPAKAVKPDVKESNRSTRGRGSQQPVKAVKQTPQSLKKKNTRDESEGTSESESNAEEASRSTRSRGSQQPSKTVKQTPQSVKKKISTEESEGTSETDSRSEESSRSTRGRGSQQPVKAVKQTPQSSSDTRSTRQKGGKTPARSVKAASDVTQSASKMKGRAAKHKLENSSDSDMPRSSRTKSAQETPVAPPSPKKSNLASSSVDLGVPRSPKKVTFIPMQELKDDTDMFTPNVKSKAALRRKTLLPNLDNAMSDVGSTPGVSRSRGKRKTIGGTSDLASTTPPKRLKLSERGKSVSPSQAEDDADNLLESDGNYSNWIPLKNIDAKVPPKSGVYEVKVWNAKKPAYIGHCESLRQKLTLHKLQHNSGHKHLDKFIERNKNAIQIRYEVFPSFDAAKSEVKNRVKSFTALYNTTPAYN